MQTDLSTTQPYSMRDLMKDLFRWAKPYKWKLVGAFVLRAISDLAHLYPGYALSQIILILSRGITDNIANEVYTILFLWVVVFIFRGPLKNFAKKLAFDAGESMSIDAEAETLSHLFKLDLFWHERENSGNKVKRMYNGREGIRSLLKMFFTNIIESVLNTVVITYIFFTIGIELGLSIVGYIVVFYVVSIYLSTLVSKRAITVSRNDEDLNGSIFESINNIRTLKSLDLFEGISAGIAAKYEVLRKSIYAKIRMLFVRGIIQSTIYNAVQLFVIIFIVVSILNGRFDIGVLVLFSQYFGKIGDATDELTEVTNEMIIAKVSIGRMVAIQKAPVIIDDAYKVKQFPKNWQKLSVKNLSFKYGEKDVLHNINLEIHRGEKIGIVGISGAGKSTFFKLLLDLYEDYVGEISFDGISMKEINRSSFIDNVSVVLQDTELFNMSFKENIFLAKSSKSRESLLGEAIHLAELDDVVTNLSLGSDTVIGEKGVKLSGGEKQRLGIARALYRQPDLLLLDEATSHLDVDSEKKIQTSLSRFFKNVTAVVIAHRLSTVREMDRIIVFDNGRIVEDGKFEDLIRQNGNFQRLWEKQVL